MVEAVAVLAVALLVAGIVGTLIPLVPGGLLSLSGLYLYWWHTGFTEPGPIALGVLTALGLLTLLAEFFGGSAAAKPAVPPGVRRVRPRSSASSS